MGQVTSMRVGVAARWGLARELSSVCVVRALVVSDACMTGSTSILAGA